jgi:hypothetical protein
MKINTTFLLDEESFYFFSQIALQEAKKNNIIFENNNQIIRHILNFIKLNKNNIIFKNTDVQYIHKSNVRYVIFFKYLNDDKEILVNLQEELSKIMDFKIKNNQIIKIILNYYYNYLINN